ncbi:hypothetical protein LXA43DRAFT_1101153 [Ganoderma leucocontextum]|nr:hypothetical protein LXA43DRAFT_1101153 [Ganoderma leucocontextum]
MDYPDKHGNDFWDYVDERLAYLRKKEETPDQLVRAFKYFLTMDRQQHGSDAVQYAMDELIVDPLQQTIDDSIARTTQVAITPDGEQEADDDEEGQEELGEPEIDDGQARAGRAGPSQ